MLVDTTRFNSPGITYIRNIALGNKNEPLPGVGDFVVSSLDIMTLSVRSLIIVPVVLAAIFLITWVIGLIPAPWRMTDALDGSCCIVTSHENADAQSPAEWNRQSLVSYTSRHGEAFIRLAYSKKNGEVFWIGIDRQTEAAAPAASGTESGEPPPGSTIEKDKRGDEPYINIKAGVNGRRCRRRGLLITKRGKP